MADDGESPATSVVAHTSDEPSLSEKESKAMLDVHAAHAGIHTWRDFLVHIATITIGLLIAIGLEQTVEYVHHLGQLQTARRELAIELDDNLVIAKSNITEFQKSETELEKDMALLIAARQSHNPISGKLDYSRNFRRMRDAAWQTVRQNGTLELMPHAELQRYAYVYAVIGDSFENMKEMGVQMDIADAISRRSPGGALSERDIDDLITATSDAQGKLALLRRMLQYGQTGIEQAR